MIHRLCLLTIIAITLSACGSSVQQLSVSAKPIEIDISKTADPAAVKLYPIQFKVVNKSNLDAFIANISKAQGTSNPVFIAITTKDYENLSLSLADLHRYIEQQQAVIVYYRNLTTHTPSTSTLSN